MAKSGNAEFDRTSHEMSAYRGSKPFPDAGRASAPLVWTVGDGANSGRDARMDES